MNIYKISAYIKSLGQKKLESQTSAIYSQTTGRHWVN